MENFLTTTYNTLSNASIYTLDLFNIQYDPDIVSVVIVIFMLFVISLIVNAAWIGMKSGTAWFSKTFPFLSATIGWMVWIAFLPLIILGWFLSGSSSSSSSTSSSKRTIRHAHQDGDYVYVKTTDGLGWSEPGTLVGFSENMVSIRRDHEAVTKNPQGVVVASSFV